MIMNKLLHIIATPRGDESRTLKVSESFLSALNAKYSKLSVDTLDLFKEKLPDLTLKTVTGKYVLLSGRDLAGDLKTAWQDIERHITRFLSADAYLISSPMWNFGIPYALKQYVDIILQPKYLFRYTEKGPEGLVKNKKMAVITSRGGDYSPGSPFHPYDLQEPYIKAVFNFVGITDIYFVNAQPMDSMGPAVANEKMTEAQGLASRVTDNF